jgi:hypothetical protein
MVKTTKMSSTPSFSLFTTPTQSPSGSASQSSTTSVTVSVTYSSSPMLTPSTSPTASGYTSMQSTHTALWSPFMQTQTPTPSPSQTRAQVQPLVNMGLTVGEMTIIFTVLGILILIGIINTIHYNKKYKAEKMKRLTEIRNNPLHSQVRTILPI